MGGAMRPVIQPNAHDRFTEQAYLAGRRLRKPRAPGDGRPYVANVAGTMHHRTGAGRRRAADSVYGHRQRPFGDLRFAAVLEVHPAVRVDVTPMARARAVAVTDRAKQDQAGVLQSLAGRTGSTRVVWSRWQSTIAASRVVLHATGDTHVPRRGYNRMVGNPQRNSNGQG